MNIHAGYKDIEVNLLEFPRNIFSKAYEFGKYGRGDKAYLCENQGTLEDKSDFIEELERGEAFPKYCLEQRMVFEIKGISRIVLAQLTRDRAFFCSESGGVRPLSQDIIMPLNIYNDADIMEKVIFAQKLLEAAYIQALENDIPYPDARYIGLHSQTISVTAAFTIGDFRRACYSRTNNSFCDELNYVYRKMWWAARCEIEKLPDYDRVLCDLFLGMSQCINDSYLKTMHLYNSDFQYKDLPTYCVDTMYNTPSINDWRCSAWKMELERIVSEENYLLTRKEDCEIRAWMREEKEGRTLQSSFDENNYRSGRNLVKEMDYYDGVKNNEE